MKLFILKVQIWWAIKVIERKVFLAKRVGDLG